MASKPSPFINLILVILGLAFGLFYYFQIARSSLATPPVAPVTEGSSILKFNDIKIDFSFFDKPAFKSLRLFGEAPVNPGATGKTNPFSP